MLLRLLLMVVSLNLASSKGLGLIYHLCRKNIIFSWLLHTDKMQRDDRLIIFHQMLFVAQEGLPRSDNTKTFSDIVLNAYLIRFCLHRL